MSAAPYPWLDDAWRRLVDLTDRLPHALLISGPQGIGKLALAERFAGLLLCETPGRGGAACGTCNGCLLLKAGSHPDLRRLEPDAMAPAAESEGEGETRSTGGTRGGKPSADIRIDQVRELADFLYLGSHRGRHRIVIVHPAEAMNVHAANALLKGLEEPPPGACFLLVSHRPARLLPTIRSRCTGFPVNLPPRDLALRWLADGGVKDAPRWLAFAGGAPLVAHQLGTGTGPVGGALNAILTAFANGHRPEPHSIRDRESVQSLIDALQKYALDQALGAMGSDALFGFGKSARTTHPAGWLRLARRMGRARALGTHPLNVQLVVNELLAGLDSTG